MLPYILGWMFTELLALSWSLYSFKGHRAPDFKVPPGLNSREEADFLATLMAHAYTYVLVGMPLTLAIYIAVKWVKSDSNTD